MIKKMMKRSTRFTAAIKSVASIRPKGITYEKMAAIDRIIEDAEGRDKVIWVIRLEFYDGSKFYIRTDSNGWSNLIMQKKREKGREFMELPTVRQIKLREESVKRLGSLVCTTQMRMTEAEYLKVPLI